MPTSQPIFEMINSLTLKFVSKSAQGTKEDRDFCSRIHKTLFPKKIESIFPGILSDGTEFIYTTFDYQQEGFTPLALDFKTENEDFVRKYYTRQISYYFQKT